MTQVARDNTLAYASDLMKRRLEAYALSQPAIRVSHKTGILRPSSDPTSATRASYTDDRILPQRVREAQDGRYNSLRWSTDDSIQERHQRERQAINEFSREYSLQPRGGADQNKDRAIPLPAPTRHWLNTDFDAYVETPSFPTAFAHTNANKDTTDYTSSHVRKAAKGDYGSKLVHSIMPLAPATQRQVGSTIRRIGTSKQQTKDREFKSALHTLQQTMEQNLSKRGGSLVSGISSRRSN